MLPFNGVGYPALAAAILEQAIWDYDRGWHEHKCLCGRTAATTVRWDTCPNCHGKDFTTHSMYHDRADVLAFMRSPWAPTVCALAGADHDAACEWLVREGRPRYKRTQ